MEDNKRTSHEWLANKLAKSDLEIAFLQEQVKRLNAAYQDVGKRYLILILLMGALLLINVSSFFVCKFLIFKGY